jgi:hypothetical protein
MSLSMVAACMAVSLVASDPMEACFVENLGQWEEEVLFATEIPGAAVWLVEEGMVLRTDDGRILRSNIAGHAAPAEVSGEGLLPWKVSFFLGDDPSAWCTSVPCWSSVRFADAWPGVDLVVRRVGSDLVFRPLPGPNADSAPVRFEHDDPRAVRPTGSGGFIVPCSRPVPDVPRPVTAEVDVSWSTFLGGSVEDRTYSIGIGPDGDVYVTGRTSSPDFPLEGALQDSLGGGSWDGFVTRFTSDGSQLVYSTYFGGSGADNGYGIKIGPDGSAYVTGPTESADFPTMDPLQPDLSGSSDAFALKLPPDGSSLVYSTYLGGSGTERGRDLAVDGQGRAHICGTTSSADFPVVSAYQPDYGGGEGDAFACRLSASGGSLDYATYLGGSSVEYGEGIHVDGEGAAYLTGSTASQDFPVVDAFQDAYGGGDSDGFVAKLEGGGDQVDFSGYLGGSGGDGGQNIAATTDGSFFVTGFTDSGDFPLQNPYQDALLGPSDAFLSGLSSSGATLVFSTYMGGSADDQGRDLAVSGTGNVHVVGYTSSDDFPTANAYQPDYAGGGNDVFTLEMPPDGSSMIYSTYLGGSGNDSGRAIDVDAGGSACLTGGIASEDFPTVDPFQGSFGGGFTDSFVARLAPFPTGVDEPAEPPTTALTVELVSPNPTAGPLSVRVDMPGPGGLSLELYDTSGRRLDRVFVPEMLSPGLHGFHLGAEDPLPGVYFLRAHSPEQGTASIKAVLL